MYKYDYLIIGPGAIGLFLAAKLQISGLKTAILDYKPARAEELNNTGITLVAGERITVSIPVFCHPEISASCHKCIIVTKSYNTSDAAISIQPFIKDNMILTIQNGLGNIETIKEIINSKNIIAGSTTQGALREKIDTVRDTGTGVITMDGNHYLSHTICKEFSEAKIKTELTDDIDKILWGKAIINSAINPLGALTNSKNGELLTESLVSLISEIIKESTTVANGMGIGLSEQEYLTKTISICKATSNNTNSMLSDIINGKRTEIDAINGKITGYGDKLNIPVPVNRTLWTLIKAIENRQNQRLYAG
jgi:2-dehydropantoate 2-reductase